MRREARRRAKVGHLALQDSTEEGRRARRCPLNPPQAAARTVLRLLRSITAEHWEHSPFGGSAAGERLGARDALTAVCLMSVEGLASVLSMLANGGAPYLARYVRIGPLQSRGTRLRPS